MVLPTTPHPHPYTIWWLHQGRYIHVSQQCWLPHNIKLFMDEVLCDATPLEVCNVLLDQPYLWKFYAVYESRPSTIKITLGNKLYRITKVAPLTAISLVSTKKCSKIISQTGRFVFILILSQSKRKIVATSMAPGKGSLMQQKIRWIMSWKNTRTYSPHLQGHLCTVSSSIWSIWLREHHYSMGWYIAAPLWKMRKSSGRSKSCYKKGTINEVPRLVEPDCTFIEEGWNMTTLIDY